jgi:hypothetical protein
LVSALWAIIEQHKFVSQSADCRSYDLVLTVLIIIAYQFCTVNFLKYTYFVIC